jgi:hypothetical protein
MQARYRKKKRNQQIVIIAASAKAARRMKLGRIVKRANNALNGKEKLKPVTSGLPKHSRRGEIIGAMRHAMCGRALGGVYIGPIRGSRCCCCWWC